MMKVVRLNYAAMDRKVFQYNDPIWKIWFPPNGFQCRCIVRSLSKQYRDKNGIKVENESEIKVKPDKTFNNPGEVLDNW
jgi:uncharacterized protein with gpF-like domain